MRDDVETLLREAGDEPTRPYDLDEVLTRGARRATARRVAAGAGGLAVVAALAVAVPALLPDREPVPFVDEQPSETAPEEDAAPADPTPSTSPSEEAPTGEDPGPATDATGVGAPLATLSLTDTGVEVVLTATDGSTTSYTTTSLPREQTTEAVVVDGDGRVVYVDEAGTLTRADAASTAAVRSAEEGPWAVLGTTAPGEVLVARGGGPLGDDDGVWVLTDTDVVLPAEVPVITGFPRDRTITAPQEEALGTATSSGDGRLVASLGIGDSTRWLEARSGDVTEIYSSATMPFVTWRLAPTFVDGELWAIEWEAVPDGAGPEVVQEQNLVLRAGEADELVLPLPAGRELDGYAQRITTGAMPDGSPAALVSVVTDDGRVTLLVDVAAARAGDPAAVTRLGATGDVRFLG